MPSGPTDLEPAPLPAEPAGPPDSTDTPEPGEPVARDGHETQLPSIARSALSTKSAVARARLHPSGFSDITETPRAQPGAKPNDVIGSRYIVEGQLGRGGMGRVMRVRHAVLGKVFALKLIKSTIATDPKIRELFYREARLASAFAHDNICSIVDFGLDDRFGLFMVMELLEGQTAHHKLRNGGAMSAKVACDILWQVADAVRFIHSRAVLHGDIKSENIFLVKTTSQRRLVKLLDFGLARPDLHRTEGIDGTPEYLAPERQDGAPASQASDIYALGIVLFELLTGQVPFIGKMADVLAAHKTTAVPVPSSRTEEPIDERADALVARATAKDPSQRHPDVPSFMYELRALMGMLGMGHSRRRPPVAPARERRDLDHRLKAAAEVFGAVPLPMASCDAAGRVRAANPAFLEFLGVAGDAAGLELADSGLPDVYPALFEDLRGVAAQRRPIKRVIYLNEGGDRVIEAAILLSPAPSAAEVTAGEVHLVLHPLRAIAGDS